jgi:soluble lytic murein transglycosylase
MKKSIFAAIIIFGLLASACAKNKPVSSNPPPSKPIIQSTPIPTLTPTPTPEIRFSNAEEFLLSGDYDAAYQEFQIDSTQSTKPDLVSASMLGMGHALMLKKDYYGAVNQFSTLLINFPTEDARNTAYFFLAQTYDALNQPRLAADAYANYLAAMPGPLDSEINEMRGNALEKYGDYNGAIAAYQTAISKTTSNDTDQLQLELAKAYTVASNNDQAIPIYLNLIENGQNTFSKAQADLLLGDIYLKMGMPEQAYARFQDTVNNYPAAYDSYSALVDLVNDNQIVDQLNRGIIDYNAGQYGIAIQALDDYMNANPDHDAKANEYKAKSLFALNRYQDEIAEWDEVIAKYSSNEAIYYEAYDEKSYTQWLSLNDFQNAAQTCLTYVASDPTSLPNAPVMLDKAARIYVDGGYLSLGAQTFERVFTEYPGSDQAYPDLFKAGILYYRLNEFSKAQLTFERLIVLTTDPEEQAAANLWVAKSLEKQGKTTDATAYFQKAAAVDPGGYYGIRANQILNGQSPFLPLANIDLGIDYKSEKSKADRWMVSTFQLNSSVDLSSMGELANNPTYQQAEEYNKLGMRDEALGEFETLRNSLVGDAVNTYRLMNRTLELGYYRTAIYASRHVLDLAGLSQAATLSAPPIYFNHIRFGVFFHEYILPDSQENSIDPIMTFSIIRQESMFDTSITSVAAAEGLMQITPDTATNIVANFGWPKDFVADDLNRPVVNIRLGTHYFKRCLDLYDGDYYAALASYNAGDIATTRWMQLAGGDPDLFLEIISYSETKDYIKSIAENYDIYRGIYTR